MTRSQALSPLVAKEVRALLPIAGATLTALAAAFTWRHRALAEVGVLAYVIGVMTIGAHAIGHEYTYRTLPFSLGQPIARWRMFAIKFAVIIAMLSVLGAIAAAIMTSPDFREPRPLAAALLPVLAGVCVTPLFAMLCRSTLAGAVLGASSPMVIWILSVMLAWAIFGVDGDTTTTWFLDQWVVIAAIACPILGALTWRAYHRMEAIDGTPAPLTLPRWLAGRAGVRRTAPWRALITKELHLQQMTIAITLVYAVFWVTSIALQPHVPSMLLLPLEAVLLLYCMGLTIVIGALASAEERQLGTHEAQLLQPVGAWRQWIAKCAVALGLALLLGVVMPAVLIRLVSPQPLPSQMRTEISVAIALLAVVLTASSLWISSMTSSGVKAMAWAVPVGVGAALFVQTVQTTVASASAQLGTPVPADHTEAFVIASRVLPLLVVPALLWFGYLNHMSGERSVARIISQIAALALLIVASIVIAGVLV